ncbi:uncharacterized protein RCC_12042 [Ramularia collo-cygni]|uniref:Uncharacterized protein n=1 Tax=Ramularia collo-cygni TaxID=112498 RepID=A0A2D3ULH3_9PEZI|nr:uncharacterized protein RCC_12042 [Ramularia collo-cygni]CZT14882.1 uncharacterized protein RCC_12042 [Ramularia collo-cygni]
MASTLAALTSITSFLAHAYYLTGRTYHSLPDRIPGLRNAFTVSPTRELPDLITIFGMVEGRLLCAHAAMLGGDEYLLIKQLYVANELIYEAWWKVSWLDRAVANGPGDGEDDELCEDVDDSGEEFEKWRAALPNCCGTLMLAEDEALMN